MAVLRGVKQLMQHRPLHNKYVYVKREPVEDVAAAWGQCDPSHPVDAFGEGRSTAASLVRGIFKDGGGSPCRQRC